MKRTKRLVALLVTIATLASLFVFSVPASAEELPRVEVTAEDELRIEKLEALGVIDVKYNAASYVTRRQMAEIIVRYMNLAVTSSEAETPFRDVKTSDTAYVAIRTLYDMGIVSGDYDKRFNPDNYLTYDEALVFIINAIGYKMFAVREGGYPTGYHRVAISHGMLKNLSIKNGSDAVKLPDVYKMLEAALNAAAIEESFYGNGDSTYSFSATETFLSTTYGIRKYRGVVSGNEYTRLANAKATLTDEQIEIDGANGKKVYETPGYFYGYMLGYTVDYYLKDAKGVNDYELKYIEEANKLNKKIKIDADDLLVEKTAASSNRIYYKDADKNDEHISFGSVYYIYNNQSAGFTTFADVLPARGYIEALDNNSDGIYDVLFVYEYVSYVVEAVDTYDNFIKVKDGESTKEIDLDNKREKCAIYLVGSTELKDINAVTAGSVISVLESASSTYKVRTIYVSNKTITGTITTVDSDDGYLIGGNYYKPYDGVSFKVGTNGLFYIDMNDQVVDYAYNAADDKAVYGIMTAYEKGENRDDAALSVKIYTSTGEFAVLPLAERVKLNEFRDLLDESGKYIETKSELKRYDLTNKSDVAKAVSWITHDDGEITSLYPVKYTVVNDEITSMEQALPTTKTAAEGVFNTMQDKIGTVYLRSNGAMFYGKTVGVDGYNNYLYSASTVKGFVIPPDAPDANTAKENFGEIKNYANKISISDGKYELKTDEGIYYTLYSFGTEAKNRIDLMVFKSKPTGADVSTDTMAVIKKITDYANEDGIVVKKLYLNENTEVVLADKIRLLVPISCVYHGLAYMAEKDFGTTGGHHAVFQNDDVSLDTIIENNFLDPGNVIIYGTNGDGVVDSIRVIANYDESELNPDLKLKSMFRIKDGIYGSYTGGSDVLSEVIDKLEYVDSIYYLHGSLHEANSTTIATSIGSGGAADGKKGSGSEKNIVIGKITGVNKTPGTISFELPQYLKYVKKDDDGKAVYEAYEKPADQLLKITTNGSYNLFNSEDNTVEHLTLSRFREGDIFIASLDKYNDIKTIIVFR